MTPPLVNLFADDWDEHRSSSGYTWQRSSIGRRLGGELLGASLYQLPPGQRSWPYHAHYANEEMLIVLDGCPTLRTTAGECELHAGDATIFRRGPEGAHQLLNQSHRSARIVLISTLLHPEVAHFPNSDRLAVFAGAAPVPGETAPIELLFRTGDATSYWEDEHPDA